MAIAFASSSVTGPLAGPGALESVLVLRLTRDLTDAVFLVFPVFLAFLRFVATCDLLVKLPSVLG
jgi:hypothetical protein